MATTLKYGSQGDEVKKLQQTLGIKADGIYGKQTEAAVKAYQKANGLAEDGIVGKNTWGALNKASTPSTAPSTTPSATPTTPKFEYADYAESDVVKQANDLLQQQIANKPGEYQSNWQTQLNDTLNKILNREKFSYDLNGDALYQQYKDQYTTQGQMAMMDTMGQAQAMTGGYGNSYAQTVGQQTYQGYLQQLNDRVPELYQLALDQHNQETQNLYNQYGLYADRENQEYGRYQDAVNNWNAERDYLTNRYDSERSYDYGKYADERSFEYGKYSDDITNQWKQKELDMALEQIAYQKERDAVEDDHWQKQYDLSKKSASSGGGGGSSSKTTPILGGWSEKDFTSAMQQAADDGDKNYAKQLVISAGGTSAAYEIYNLYFGDTSKGVDTTVDKLTAQEKRLHGGSGGSFRVHQTR